MKVAIIVPRSTNKKQMYSEYPLGAGYIGTIIFNLGHNVKIYDQNVEYTKNEELVNEIIRFSPDLICFSILTPTYPITLEIINILKKKNISTPILAGGIHPTLFPIDCLNEGIDYVIKGEGEIPIEKFIYYMEGKEEIFNIPNLSYKDKNGVIVNKPNEKLDIDINKLPFINRDLFNIKKYKMHSISGSRGCPFRCKYCLSSTTHGVRFHSIERTLEELNFFIKKGVRLVKFVDRTFNCNHKYSMSVWDFLIKADTNTKFHFEISADILKNEEIELLRKAPKGRFQFEVGVQTTNDDVLKNINRFVNFSDIKEKVVELLSINNINQHLDLIAGLPGEDYNSFVKSFNDVHSIKPEEIQLGFLKLLKGSDMRRDSSLYNMKYSPYPPYEILSTDKISYDEIQILKRVEAVVDKYYNSQKFNTTLEFFYKKFETPYEFFYELGNYFENKGYFNKNIGNTEYYKVFLDFNMEILKGKEDYLVDIIRYDYLSFNKKRGIPEFLRSNIDKNIEEEIKDKYRDEYSFRRFSVEYFSIDIDKFINEKEIERKDVYYLIGNEGEKIKLH